MRVTSAKDKQKSANQCKTKVRIGMAGYYSETTQNTDTYLLSNNGKTIGKSGKCKERRKKKSKCKKNESFCKVRLEEKV